MDEFYMFVVPLLVGYLLDLMFGDPAWLPHPIVYFGKWIKMVDNKLNNGENKIRKGFFAVLILVGGVFSSLFLFFLLLKGTTPGIYISVASIFVFWGLANRTLIEEGKAVFDVLDKKGLEAGRKQVARIVGRDTSKLTDRQIKLQNAYLIIANNLESMGDIIVRNIYATLHKMNNENMKYSDAHPPDWGR